MQKQIKTGRLPETGTACQGLHTRSGRFFLKIRLQGNIKKDLVCAIGKMPDDIDMVAR